MLRQVMKRFDGDNNITFKPGDVVDVSDWRNRESLEDQRMIGPTDASKATIDPNAEKSTKSAKKSSTPKLPAKMRRSALASRPRVFTRKA